MNKLIYKPVGLVAGVLAGYLAGKLFHQVWHLVAHEDDTPDPTDADRSWTEVLAAAALEGAIFAAARAAASRSGAVGVRRLTGEWPG